MYYKASDVSAFSCAYRSFSKHTRLHTELFENGECKQNGTERKRSLDFAQILFTQKKNPRRTVCDFITQSISTLQKVIGMNGPLEVMLTYVKSITD